MRGGLGLMGGSMALALRGHVAEITAVETDDARRAQARERGLVVTADDDLALTADADIVILATPLRTLVGLVEEVGALMNRGALMLDLGSVKSPVVAAMNRLPDQVRAVGMHPMGGQGGCGIVVCGWEFVPRDTVCGLRNARMQPYAETKELVGMLIEAIGGRQIIMDAEQHDRMRGGDAACAVCAGGSVGSLCRGRADEDGVMWSLAEAGFGDTSRLAGERSGGDGGYSTGKCECAGGESRCGTSCAYADQATGGRKGGWTICGHC